MRSGVVCVGGHDLDDEFRSLRLLTSDGQNLKEEYDIEPPEVWELKYATRADLEPPHVEDVLIQGKAKFVEKVSTDIVRELVLEYDPPWNGDPEEIFDRTADATGSGRIYIPGDSRLPSRSTGYWLPDAGLDLHGTTDKPMFRFEGDTALKEFTWAGMHAPPERIEAGTLVRVSLARYWEPSAAPAGYYAQISDVF